MPRGPRAWTRRLDTCLCRGRVGSGARRPRSPAGRRRRSFASVQLRWTELGPAPPPAAWTTPRATSAGTPKDSGEGDLLWQVLLDQEGFVAVVRQALD